MVPYHTILLLPRGYHMYHTVPSWRHTLKNYSDHIVRYHTTTPIEFGRHGDRNISCLVRNIRRLDLCGMLLCAKESPTTSGWQNIIVSGIDEIRQRYFLQTWFSIFLTVMNAINAKRVYQGVVLFLLCATSSVSNALINPALTPTTPSFLLNISPLIMRLRSSNNCQLRKRDMM